MIINEIIVDGKSIFKGELDTSLFAKESSFNDDSSRVNVRKSSDQLDLFVETNEKVPPSFKCKGRCDNCEYRNYRYSGLTR